MKNTRQQLDIINAFEELGTYRAAARLCGTTDKTVKRVVARREAGELGYRARPELARNTEVVKDLVARKVKATRGLVTAKRLLPLAKAEGYRGSLRNLRRELAVAKATWRREQRSYRPWQPVAGEYLVIDWAEHRGLHLFCAVLPWSRWRFVRFARDEQLVTTLRMLAECFETLGAVPAKVLSDRMACVKTGVVANVVVPNAEYVRLATHYGFSPDFCEAADPESKGVVENLCGYAQRDLAALLESNDLVLANEKAEGWCREVNRVEHSEICAVPEQRLEMELPLMRQLPSLRPLLCRGELRKVDKMQTVRFGSARYSVPRAYLSQSVEVSAGEREVVISSGGQEIARHLLCPPGSASILDEHYGGAPRRPRRPVRPRTAAEQQFMALGPSAEEFLRAGAAAGTARLAAELGEIVGFEQIWGRQALVGALARALEFRRFRADDIRSILATNGATPRLTPAGTVLEMPLPAVPERPLSAYALDALR